jgi:hypothetical protein
MRSRRSSFFVMSLTNDHAKNDSCARRVMKGFDGAGHELDELQSVAQNSRQRRCEERASALRRQSALFAGIVVT